MKNKTSDNSWYVAHEVLYFEPELKAQQRRRRLIVWENLVLVRARSPELAYAKAIKRGKQNEGPVKINDQPARCRFRGLRELSHVLGQLEDGAELEWRTLECRPTEIGKLITPKSRLQAFRSKKKAGKTKIDSGPGGPG